MLVRYKMLTLLHRSIHKYYLTLYGSHFMISLRQMVA